MEPQDRVKHRSPPRLGNYTTSIIMHSSILEGPTVGPMEHDVYKSFTGRRLEFRQAREVAVCHMLELYGFKRQACAGIATVRSGSFKAWAVFRIVGRIPGDTYDRMIIWKYIVVPADASLSYWMAAAKRLDAQDRGRAWP